MSSLIKILICGINDINKNLSEIVIYLNVVYIILVRLIIFISGVYCYYYNFRLIIEWLIIRINRINIEFLLYIDWISLIFMRIVLLISSIVLIYRLVYIEIDKNIFRYYMLVLIFVFSIVLIIIRPNIVRIIFGWDGLGLVSFCLVVYYQNYRSYNSGILTVLINRVGDVIILIIIRIIIMYGRWNLFFIRNIELIIFFLIVAGITKRAQIPFSVWLPRAIAAPTPVSALVHSSTLVTAGVYLLIRFNKYLIMREFGKILIILSVLTMFISGLIANFEFDLKKIIALSTLRQLGLIMMILSAGFPMLGYYHLLTHAIFKSLLFIRAGVIIHRIINNQDIRIMGGLNEFIPFTIYRFNLTLMALCGFPFISGFYSKDIIMEIIYFRKFNIIIFILSLISLIFTVIYSIRLIYYSFLGEFKLIRCKIIVENLLINKSIIILIILRILIGSMLRWIFFFDEVIYLGIRYKILTLVIIFLSLIVLAVIWWVNFLKIYYLSYFFRTIWFMTYLYVYIINPFLNIRLFIYYNDKRWVEFFRKIFFFNMFIEYKNLIINYNYKIYIFIYWFVLIILVIYIYLNSLNKKYYIEDIKIIWNVFKY